MVSVWFIVVQLKIFDSKVCAINDAMAFKTRTELYMSLTLSVEEFGLVRQRQIMRFATTHTHTRI